VSNAELPTYEVVFDGGSFGNPGKGYGSFRLMTPEGHTVIRRLQFGPWVTNNEAEYRSLIKALEELLRLLRGRGVAPRSVSVIVRGDSQLVIYQLQGRWQVRKPELMVLFARVVELLKQFGSFSLAWHERAKTVEILGH